MKKFSLTLYHIHYTLHTTYYILNNTHYTLNTTHFTLHIHTTNYASTARYCLASLFVTLICQLLKSWWYLLNQTVSILDFTWTYLTWLIWLTWFDLTWNNFIWLLSVCLDLNYLTGIPLKNPLVSKTIQVIN